MNRRWANNMYNEFFGLKEKPFSLSPDPHFLFLSESHRRAKNMLEYGLMSQAGFTVITGEIGAGKTTLVHNLLSKLDDDIVTGIINNTHNSFGNLISWVLDAFDLPDTGKDNVKKLRDFTDFVLYQYSEGRRVLLVIDEAQNLSEDMLEELRLISNINVTNDIFLQLIICGQPELINKLNQPNLAQFAQRVAVDFHVRPMRFSDTARYVLHRMKTAGCAYQAFTLDAMAGIYCYSGGIPRRINTLCDMALVYAFADGRKQVDLSMINDVVKDRNTFTILRQSRGDERRTVKVLRWLNVRDKILCEPSGE